MVCTSEAGRESRAHEECSGLIFEDRHNAFPKELFGWANPKAKNGKLSTTDSQKWTLSQEIGKMLAQSWTIGTLDLKAGGTPVPAGFADDAMVAGYDSALTKHEHVGFDGEGLLSHEAKKGEYQDSRQKDAITAFDVTSKMMSAISLFDYKSEGLNCANRQRASCNGNDDILRHQTTNARLRSTNAAEVGSHLITMDIGNSEAMLSADGLVLHDGEVGKFIDGK
jgi:hypothetical protein